MDWKAVKYDLKLTKRKQRKFIRLRAFEIKILHSSFIEIMRFIKKAQLHDKKEIDSYEKFFSEIYTMASYYERVFRDLWKKEMILEGRIERIA